MLDLLKEMFSYPFMVRAILVGTIVALCSSLLGVSLVLKRYSMIGDGLSHVGSVRCFSDGTEYGPADDFHSHCGIGGLSAAADQRKQQD